MNLMRFTAKTEGTCVDLVRCGSHLINIHLLLGDRNPGDEGVTDMGVERLQGIRCDGEDLRAPPYEEYGLPLFQAVSC